MLLGPRCGQFLISRLARPSARPPSTPSVASAASALAEQDPFLTLLELLAALLTPPCEPTSAAAGQWAVHRDPAAVLQVGLQERGAGGGVLKHVLQRPLNFLAIAYKAQAEQHAQPRCHSYSPVQALLRLLYPLAVAQAAARAVPGGAAGAALQQGNELVDAVAAQLLPWLNRRAAARTLVQLGASSNAAGLGTVWVLGRQSLCALGLG